METLSKFRIPHAHDHFFKMVMTDKRFARDMMPFVNDIVKLLSRLELEQSNVKIFTEIVLTYILDRGELSNKETFLNLIRAELSPEVGEKVMTIAEQLRAEGMQQGVQKGMQQGIEIEKQSIAKRLLSEGVDLAFISKITNLSLDKIKAIQETH